MENCRTPVRAMSRHCDAVVGSSIFCTFIRTKSIATEMMNLAAANAIGGRSASPILMKNQVVLQINARMSQTMTLSESILGILVEAQARLALLQNPPAA